MPRHIAERLDACRELQPDPVPVPCCGGSGPPPTITSTTGSLSPAKEHRRLYRLLTKMAQLEQQPHSFYFI
ncbi:unnamed protein product [Leptidea sinapis]|uniref:Uncharacterized protein n=1 Tax=Leptidea sinapis TaxID=189913 RepID=A0A5E4QMS0_9NEOP|nr:unnamed protein product [Leptidea sinapis]